MRNLAQRLGIRAPSLYKHFPSEESVEAVLISIGFEEASSAQRRPWPRRPTWIAILRVRFRFRAWNDDPRAQ